MRTFEWLQRLPYRIARRLGAASLSNFFMIESSEIASQPLAPELRHVWITTDFASHLEGDLLARLSPLATHLSDEQTVCVGVRDAQTLVAFAWAKAGCIPGELNSDGDDDTRLAIYLPTDTAYIFNVYVAPEQRGRRLYAAMLFQIAQKLLERGITKIVLTTESSNPAALKSVKRMGFRRIGGARLIRFGTWSWASYPPTPMPGGIRVGTYHGDKRRGGTASAGT